MREEYREYIVAGKMRQSPTAFTLWLRPKEGERPDFIPGQFVNVLLPSRGSDAKSYTISSIPSDPGLSLTIRIAGGFSRALSLYEPGDTLHLSEPYGYFYPVDSTTPRVCVAGGIGVMPFMSFIRASVEERISPPTLLLYSNRSAEEVVGQSVFEKLERTDNHFSVRYFITREEGTLPRAHHERIGPTHLAEAQESHPNAHFFLCGSIEFVRDMRLHLKSLAISEEAIFTEAFY